MSKLMNIKITFNDFTSRRFLKLPAEDVSRISEDIAIKEKVKIRRETFACRDVKNIEISIA